jgi:hypothetical protein
MNRPINTPGSLKQCSEFAHSPHRRSSTWFVALILVALLPGSRCAGQTNVSSPGSQPRPVATAHTESIRHDSHQESAGKPEAGSEQRHPTTSSKRLLVLQMEGGQGGT